MPTLKAIGLCMQQIVLPVQVAVVIAPLVPPSAYSWLVGEQQ
jgi:hypothetical protein